MRCVVRPTRSRLDLVLGQVVRQKGRTNNLPEEEFLSRAETMEMKEMATIERTVTLGQTVITRGAVADLHPEDVLAAMARHSRCDWGDVCAEDRAANDEALECGERLLSSYSDRTGTKFWIITEWDRSVTTVLLPEDY